MKMIKDKCNVLKCMYYILGLICSVYFMYSLIENRKHVLFFDKLILFIMILIIIIDCCTNVFAKECKRNIGEILLSSLLWSITICLCDIRGVIVLIIIGTIFFYYLSKIKHGETQLSIFIIFLYLFIISFFSQLFDYKYRLVGKYEIAFIFVDLCLIVASVCLYYSEWKDVIKEAIILNKKLKRITSKKAKTDIGYAWVIIIGVVLGLRIIMTG